MNNSGPVNSLSVGTLNPGLAVYQRCALCPRECGVNRSAGQRGYCGETAELRLAAASIHRGEEPPITGTGGSGTIFVTGCGLGCVFCQNYQISQEGMGRVVGTEEFVRLCLALQDRGAENINIVTGSHVVPALVPALEAARGQGLKLPVFWNSSAYESPAALSLLEGIVDGYLPDLKTLDRGLSAGLFNAPDYPPRAEAAIKGMMRCRPLRFSGEALVSGVIIRHLVLPGHLESTRQVLRWFAEHGRDRALLSLMTQYTPIKGPAPDVAGDRAENRAGRIPGTAPAGYVETEEYETLLRWLEEFDIDNGFYQELIHDTGWLPDFSRPNPFSSALSQPVWHWKDGFLP